MKKFLIALVLVFLSGQPLTQLILILILNVLSALITLLTRPFIYPALNLTRYMIELLGIMIVIMHIVFYIQEKAIQS